MSDLAQAIQPKADQLTADDLIAGPLTIQITKVTVVKTPEQPVAVSFDGDGGKPWKPCKTMTRVLVQMWGADSAKFVGRSVTLYRDNGVKWGGLEVGGIRISHMSHINGAQTMALTMTRGSKKAFTVKPLVEAKPAAPAKTTATIADWIATSLTPLLAKCGNLADLEAAQQTKAYQAAKERGTDDDKANMRQLISETLARIEAAEESAPETEVPVDDSFPGDR